MAEENDPSGDLAAGSGPEPVSTDPGPLAAEPQMAAILARFGGRLSPDQRTRVRAGIEGTVRMAARLRAVPLGNGDEPAGAFVPYRADAESGSGRG